MQQFCKYGSVRGATGNRRPYRDPLLFLAKPAFPWEICSAQWRKPCRKFCIPSSVTSEHAGSWLIWSLLLHSPRSAQCIYNSAAPYVLPPPSSP